MNKMDMGIVRSYFLLSIFVRICLNVRVLSP